MHYEKAGQGKMEKIETIITRGTNRYASAGIESGYTLYQARPMKIRIETEFQGSEVIQTYNGEQGYMIAPSMGIPEPKEMNRREVESLLNQVEFENPLWNYQEEGSMAELLERESETAAYAIQLTAKNGEVTVFHIDRESYLITRVHSTRVIGGSSTEIITELSDYKTTRGIPVARTIVTRMNGETVSTVLIDKVEFNKNIDPALFERPGAALEEK